MRNKIFIFEIKHNPSEMVKHKTSEMVQIICPLHRIVTFYDMTELTLPPFLTKINSLITGIFYDL